MVEELLSRLHEKYKPCDDGEVFEPDRCAASEFGLAVTAVDGTQWATGDADKEFPIQSISKPLVYALALGLLGEEKVAAKVNCEPSREPYNAIVLEEGTGRPANAMLNAGALAICSLMLEIFGDDAWDRIYAGICGAAGRSLSIDENVWQSEEENGARHRAMLYLMLSQGAISADPEEVVNLYFRQCSILLNVRDLSSVAATLANTGFRPGSKMDVFPGDVIQDVLSVMLTCGMYNAAGIWVYKVGIPAKSGVGGGLLGVVNRQAGIATYSPPLDSEGHSIRGMKAFEDISRECALHAFHPRNHGSNFLEDEFGDRSRT